MVFPAGQPYARKRRIAVTLPHSTARMHRWRSAANPRLMVATGMLAGLAARDETGDLPGRKLVQREAQQLRARRLARDTFLAETGGVRSAGLGGSDKRQEVLLHELPQRRLRLLLPDARAALGQRGAVRGFHPLPGLFVGLAGALADQFSFLSGVAFLAHEATLPL